MAYDIPDKIAYKEKIVFGLTINQLLHAVVFTLLAFFSFNLPIYGEAKFFLPAIFLSLGAGFVYCDLWRLLLERWNYHTGIREGGAMDTKVQSFIGIRKIENDTAYMSNGQIRAILSVTPVNFQNMDKDRRKSLVMNYRDFLNQLNHPVQILVRTVNVDLGEYFAHHDERVEKTKNQQLIALYRDFKLFEQKYVSEHRVKERLYYLIIPYDPSDSFVNRYKDKIQIFKERVSTLFSSKREEHALMEDEAQRKELSDRTIIIQQKLQECGIATRRMSTNELISLFMSYFDGYAEVDEDYLSRVVVARKFYDSKRGEEDAKKEAQAKAQKSPAES